MKEKAKNRLAAVLLAISIVILTITFSIGLPIYVRPFYYAHIDALGMVEQTGFDEATIRDAYDEVLDFLTLPGGEFGSGELKFSEEGASHFADCKGLFNLNLGAFIASALVLVVILALRRRGVVDLKPSVTVWAGASTLTLFVLLAAVVAIDFDTAFEIFHAIFFPGKDNWLFDPHTDEIIRVMPEEFFMNCGILIVSSIILISVACIILGVTLKKRQDR